MKKLERSIRHELAWIGPGLRSGSYALEGHSTGPKPCGGFVSALYCDVDVSGGVVTCARIYGREDKMDPRDIFGRSLNVSNALKHYLSDVEFTWDDFVNEIVEAAREYINEAMGDLE